MMSLADFPAWIHRDNGSARQICVHQDLTFQATTRSGSRSLRYCQIFLPFEGIHTTHDAFLSTLIAGRSLHPTRGLRAGHSPGDFSLALLGQLFPHNNASPCPFPAGCPPVPRNQR